jgi:hypothetical protein
MLSGFYVSALLPSANLRRVVLETSPMHPTGLPTANGCVLVVDYNLSYHAEGQQTLPVLAMPERPAEVMAPKRLT